MVEQLDPPVGQTAAPENEPAEGQEGWTPPPGASNEARFKDWMTQLQAMIDGVATAAAPHVREIAAKAAELAAKAGDAAGPFATRAAAATSDVGQKVAAKSRDFAADMRRAAEADAEAAGTVTEAGDGSPVAGASAAPVAEATVSPVAGASAAPSAEPAAESTAQTPFTEG